MHPQIRKYVTLIDEAQMGPSGPAEKPLRRVAACAVVKNPYAGQPYQSDLSLLVQWSTEIGRTLGRMAVEALGEPAESYGKGGIAGTAGEQEHVNAFLTTAFGNELRDAVGGGLAWITSATKVGPPGSAVDIPLAYKDALYVRSHYDALEVRIPDAPLPDECVVIAVVANRGRLDARLGGLKKEEVQGIEGVR